MDSRTEILSNGARNKNPLVPSWFIQTHFPPGTPFARDAEENAGQLAHGRKKSTVRTACHPAPAARRIAIFRLWTFKWQIYICLLKETTTNA
jgi:hypothetical protein